LASTIFDVGLTYDSLTYLLTKAAKRALGALDEELAPIDLTVRQYLLLSIAAGGTELSQQDLAKKLDLDPTIVVKVIDNLEDRGLLERARSADDRRRHQLTLTAKGKKLLHDAHAREQKVERALSPHSAELRDLLHEFLGL
jgi:DNA-binding MarR family transcriptional regulator